MNMFVERKKKEEEENRRREKGRRKEKGKKKNCLACGGVWCGELNTDAQYIIMPAFMPYGVRRRKEEGRSAALVLSSVLLLNHKHWAFLLYIYNRVACLVYVVACIFLSSFCLIY